MEGWIHSYLSYLRDRLTVARDLLHESGSIFAQIGGENIQRARCILDEVFGAENFVSQISFLKTTSATSDFLSSVSDYILWYARRIDSLKYRLIYKGKQRGGEGAAHYSNVQLAHGTRRPATASERNGTSPLPSGAVLFTADQLQSAGMGREKGEGAASWFTVGSLGCFFSPTVHSRWKTNELGMQRLIRANRFIAQNSALIYVRRIDDFPAFALNNIWSDVGGAP